MTQSDISSKIALLDIRNYFVLGRTNQSQTNKNTESKETFLCVEELE